MAAAARQYARAPHTRDPSADELLSIICFSEESAIAFAEEVGLLPTVNQVVDQPKCTLTPGCNGILRDWLRPRKNGNALPNVRCSRCKRMKSKGNGSSVVGGPGTRTWFNQYDINGRPCRRLTIRQIFKLMWCFCQGYSHVQTHQFFGGELGDNNETITDWNTYIREVLYEALNNAPAMGGPGQVVEIDESHFGGWGKYGRGRVLAGQAIEPRARNYGDAVIGPWVFGLAWKRPNGKVELRMFHVLRRNRDTLIPIIQRHVAPHTQIWSDEWRAYRTLAQLPRQNYQHHTVNHSDWFVDPITGVNTQLIESCWSHVKPVIRMKMGQCHVHMMPGYLAEIWFRKINNPDQLYWKLISQIRRCFPQ